MELVFPRNINHKLQEAASHGFRLFLYQLCLASSGNSGHTLEEGGERGEEMIAVEGSMLVVTAL